MIKIDSEYRGDRMLRVGTVFSGIGAMEHALERLNIAHEIIFACDNGGIDIWKKVSPEDKEREIERILSIQDPIKRKQEVDALYSKSRKKNFVQQSYLANYPIDASQFYQDVTFLDGTYYKDKIDIFVGGSPCQSFSVAGKRGGLEDTRGTLFYEFARLVKEIEPKVFIYENVKGVTSHDKGKTWEVMQNVFEDLGYDWHWSILNAKDYEIPQSRNRLFVVGFKKEVSFSFPTAKPLQTVMKDFLLDKTSEKYYLSERASASVLDKKKIKKKYTQINGDIALCQKAQQQFNLQGDFIYEPTEKKDGTPIPEKYFLSDKLITYVLASGTKGYQVTPTIDTDIAKTLLATMNKMHRANIDNYVTTNGRLRKLTPRECLRLMGFCDSFQIAVSDTQMYRQAGNSIVVDVLIALLKQIFEAYSFEKQM